MSEILVKKELTARPRDLGAVACASCPFAELGCPKQGTGDCPPPEVIEAKQAAALFNNKDVNTIWATEGGFEGVLEKPKENLRNIASMSSIVASPQTVKRPINKPIPKIEKPKQIVAPKPPKQRGQLFGEFVASLLLPTRKPS